MTERYPYPDKETKRNCLDRLRETNYQLELYNLSLDKAISQVDLELAQQRRGRLLQKPQSVE
jgi:hypothetical protein